MAIAVLSKVALWSRRTAAPLVPRSWPILTPRKALVAVLLLAACVQGGGSSGVSSVLGGAAKVAVPAGYCIDPKASQGGGDAALIIAGRCASDRPVPPAVLTISFGTEGSSSVLQSGARALSEWARSPAGRAALARDGRASSVAVRETLVWDGAFLMRLEDRRSGGYWRGAFGVKGRLVMISVTPPGQGGLQPAEGRGILERAITVLRRVNAAP
ncbi:hypothetical protein Q9295_10905 [Xinfangfangia sp. CPCC 101601]|uniref:Cation transport ATPase n=1 Tax=Pseudogemmobacter lacusdianii TaxID=3069608 RepID=A0ABU0W1B4_9RHOB|nr:hypothetical protein [Xinfangfangia sp. CPCC 101601]MDQ2066885.1 hypothetical protein [Xinfangfangia sp. CPCC 101601]